MKISFYVSVVMFLLGVLASVGLAGIVPQVGLIAWNPELLPIFLTLAFLAFWLLTIYLRNGLDVNEWGESLTIMSLIIGTSLCIDLCNLSYGERLVGACASGLVYFVFWFVGYTLWSETDPRSVVLLR